MKRYIKASIFDEIASEPAGIPLSMPTKEDLIRMVNQLRGQELTDAIKRLDSFGYWYRDDKRQKRKYLIDVIESNFHNDPAECWNVTDAINTNYDLIYVVTGVPTYKKQEFFERFGKYDEDILYKRAGR